MKTYTRYFVVLTIIASALPLTLPSVGLAESYHLREIYVEAQAGEDTFSGTEAQPLATIIEAQTRADAFMDHWLPKTQEGDMVKVRIYVSGTFYGQYFRWTHPMRQAVLELRNAPEKKATFYGWRHPCMSNTCREDLAHNNFAPTVCEESSESCDYGYTFFTAPGASYLYENPEEYTGFGDILIQGLEIKHYLSGVKIFGNDEQRPAFVKLENNLFYKIGEIANNGPFGNSYSAVTLRFVENSFITGNTFMKNINYGDPLKEKVLMHALYFERSDRNLIDKNIFTEISGQPIKLRDSSDRNYITNNKFEKKGDHAVTIVPFQDWYRNWHVPESNEEQPSFLNVFQNNTYLGGYTSAVTQEYEKTGVHALVCPAIHSDHYNEARIAASTSIRLVAKGISYSCVPNNKKKIGDYDPALDEQNKAREVCGQGDPR